jgi:putative heme iron utilization protein
MSHGRHLDPVQHLNDDHAADLLAIARAIGGHRDATSARAKHIDRDGIDLVLVTPGGAATARVSFTEPVGDDPDGLRAACVDLTRRARAALAADTRESTKP